MVIIQKTFPSTKVAYVRNISKYTECKPAWEKLMSWVDAVNVKFILGKTIVLGIGHDNPEVVKDCRYDACISVDENFDESLLSGDIKIKTLEEQKCISTMHKGSYNLLPSIYQELYNGESAKGYNIDYSKPCFEIYHNNPDLTPENELLTEIFIPII